MPRYNSQQLTSFLKNAANTNGQMNSPELAHLTVGEMVVPPDIMTPKLFAKLEKIFARRGLDIGRYIVGGRDDSINPKTGLREYYFDDPGWMDDDPGTEGDPGWQGAGEPDDASNNKGKNNPNPDQGKTGDGKPADPDPTLTPYERELNEKYPGWPKGTTYDTKTGTYTVNGVPGFTNTPGGRADAHYRATTDLIGNGKTAEEDENYLYGPGSGNPGDPNDNQGNAEKDQSKSQSKGHTIGQGIGEEFDFGANEVAGWESGPDSNQDSGHSYDLGFDGDYDLGFSTDFSGGDTYSAVGNSATYGPDYATPSNQEVADTFAAAKADQEAEQAANTAASNFGAALNAVADNFAGPDANSPAANTASTADFSTYSQSDATEGVSMSSAAATNTDTSPYSTANYGYDYTASYGPDFNPGWDLGGDPNGDGGGSSQYTAGGYEDPNSTISNAGNIAQAALSEPGRSFTPSDAPAGTSVPFNQLSNLDQLNEITDYLGVGRLGTDPGPSKSSRADADQEGSDLPDYYGDGDYGQKADNQTLTGSGGDDTLEEDDKAVSLDGFDWVGSSLPGQFTDYTDEHGFPMNLSDLPETVQGDIYNLAQEYRSLQFNNSMPKGEKDARMAEIESLRGDMPRGLGDSFNMITTDNVGAIADKNAAKDIQKGDQIQDRIGQIFALSPRDIIADAEGRTLGGGKGKASDLLGTTASGVRGTTDTISKMSLMEAKSEAKGVISDLENHMINAANRGNYHLVNDIQNKIDDLKALTEPTVDPRNTISTINRLIEDD